MKLKLTVMSIGVALLLFSCQKKENETPVSPETPEKPQAQAMSAPHQQPGQPEALAHTGVVQEVLQANSYTYLHVKEKDTDIWIAIPKRETQVGETVSFAQGLEMKDFKSKDLDRTFASVYFISGVSNQAPDTAAPQASPMAGHKKPSAGKLDITVEPVAGGISLAELFANRATHATKTVTVKGKVTKVNRAIMGKNWIHLQDGTSHEGTFDLTITTQDTVNVDEIVAFTGTVTLDKDFGAGYSYEIIMEDAKQHTEE